VPLTALDGSTLQILTNCLHFAVTTITELSFAITVQSVAVARFLLQFAVTIT